MRKYKKRQNAIANPDVFWANVTIGAPDECWPWMRWRMGGGYGKLWDGNGYVYAHRYAYMLTHGAIPDGLHVCHSCDNPACVNPGHLWLGTPADNMHDRDAKGRTYRKQPRPHQPKPEGWKRRHMSAADAMAIRQSYARGTPVRELAEQYEKEIEYINRIVRGEKWKHLPIVEVQS